MKKEKLSKKQERLKECPLKKCKTINCVYWDYFVSKCGLKTLRNN